VSSISEPDMPAMDELQDFLPKNKFNKTVKDENLLHLNSDSFSDQ